MTNDFKPAKAGGNQPRLSKEEYAEKKRAEKEKVYQMIDDAALAIKKTHKDRNIPAYALTYVYNTPPINRIKEDYFKVKSGEIKEVY